VYGGMRRGTRMPVISVKARSSLAITLGAVFKVFGRCLRACVTVQRSGRALGLDDSRASHAVRLVGAASRDRGAQARWAAGRGKASIVQQGAVIWRSR
jgi:hypothetical protein